MAESIALGRPLTAEESERLQRFADLLLRWNHRMNLVGDAEPETLRHKHLVDALLYARAVGEPGTLVDVGSGNGLPGIVISLVRPGTRVVLLESMVKRCSFLETAIDELGLTNVELVCARAEEAGQHPDWREQFDVAVARRVAELPVLLEYVLPLVRCGGRAVLVKGPDLVGELAAAIGVPELLGGALGEGFELAGPPESVAAGLPAVRRYVTIDKLSPTPEAYPRRAGKAAKRPLRGAVP